MTNLQQRAASLSLYRWFGSLASLFFLSIVLFFMLQQNAHATLAAHPTAMHSALKPPSQAHWQTITIKNGDNLDKIFTRLGLSKQQLHKILALRNANKTLTNIHSSQKLQVLVGANQEVQGLSFAVNDKETLVVSKQVDDQFKADITRTLEASEQAAPQQVSVQPTPTPLINSTKTVAMVTPSKTAQTVKATAPIPANPYKQINGSVHGSIYSAGKKAGIPAKVLYQFVNAFTAQIDIGRKSKTGDQFSVVYDPHKNTLMAAAFSHQGKVYQVIRFADTHGRIAYYTPTGASFGKTFLRNPVPGSHVTSHYSVARLDPVIHEVRPHFGVDFAAPYGSPIKASGDGKVIFVGRKNGYGNTIIIQHDNRYSSMYGHMSRFNKSIHLGTDVEVGQVIGYVGSSGMSTGPHLHYAFLQHGNYQNPLSMTLPTSNKHLPKAALARFLPQAHAMLAQLAPLKATPVATNTSKAKIAHRSSKLRHLSAAKQKSNYKG